MTPTHHNDVVLLVVGAPSDWSGAMEKMTQNGYRLETAEGGVVALSMLDTLRADLLIIDNDLDDLDASEVIRIIRNAYTAPKLPIFLVVDADMEDSIQREERSELAGVIHKPINAEDLVARLGQTLHSSGGVSPGTADQQSCVFSPVEQIMPVNEAAKREIQQYIQVEQRPRAQMERRRTIGSSIQDDSQNSPSSENESKGLISQEIFKNRLTRLFNTAENGVGEHALCYLQATNLEQFQECYGETARDGLLRHLAKVLHSCMRKDDSITELGGGEFLILLQRCSVDQAEHLLSVLCGKTRSYQFIWHDEELRVDLHTGVVSVRGSDINALIEAAKTAVPLVSSAQIAKKTEPGRIEPSDTVVETGSAEYFTDAMKNGRFQFYYQPIESLHRNDDPDSVRFELFLRLQDELGRFMRPAAFLPAMERYELVSKLDRWTVSTALTWLAGHMSSSFERLTLCCINLSAQSLSDESLRDYIQSQFSETGVPPNKICFEINETAAIANIKTAARLMSELGKSGCTFALDNFGSGLSPMAYMNNLPAEYIKIDGRSVKNNTDSNVDFSTVKSVNDIAHALGKKTIVEFVEDEEALNELKKIGVDYAQGYAIGRPLPIKALLVKSLAASATV